MLVKLVVLVLVAAVGFVAGLLVGRKNPSVANVAAAVQTDAQDAAKKL